MNTPLKLQIVPYAERRPGRFQRTAEMIGKIVLWFAGGIGATVAFIIWVHLNGEPVEERKNPETGMTQAEELRMCNAANIIFKQKLQQAEDARDANKKDAELWHKKFTDIALRIDGIVRPFNASIKLADADPEAWEKFESTQNFGADISRIESRLRTGDTWHAKFSDLANAVDLLRATLTNGTVTQTADEVARKWAALSDYPAEMVQEFVNAYKPSENQVAVRRAVAVEH